MGPTGALTCYSISLARGQEYLLRLNDGDVKEKSVGRREGEREGGGGSGRREGGKEEEGREGREGGREGGRC